MKRILALFVVLLVAAPAHATPTFVYALDSQTSISSSHTGSDVPINKGITACAARLTASNGGGTSPTLNAKVQYSPDGGTSWFDELPFQQLTSGSTDQMVHVDTTVTRQFSDVRSVTTLGGTSPVYTFTIKLYCQ